MVLNIKNVWTNIFTIQCLFKIFIRKYCKDTLWTKNNISRFFLYPKDNLNISLKIAGNEQYQLSAYSIIIFMVTCYGYNISLKYHTICGHSSIRVLINLHWFLNEVCVEQVKTEFSMIVGELMTSLFVKVSLLRKWK